MLNMLLVQQASEQIQPPSFLMIWKAGQPIGHSVPDGQKQHPAIAALPPVLILMTIIMIPKVHYFHRPLHFRMRQIMS